VSESEDTAGEGKETEACVSAYKENNKKQTCQGNNRYVISIKRKRIVGDISFNTTKLIMSDHTISLC